jgi:hypothetical protein
MEILAIFKPGSLQQALIYKAYDGYVGWINVDPSNKFNQSLVDIMLEHNTSEIDIIQNGNLDDVIQKYF